MDPDREVLSLLLLDLETGQILASLQPMSKQCTTSERFSLCRIDERDSRKSSLSTLVVDLEENSSRRYGCEVVSSKTGERSNISVWSVEVAGVSK